MSDPPTDPAPHVSHKMTATSAAAVVAASMIGAGVYTTSGFTLGDLGSPYQVMLAWMVGGVIAICGAICYGALARQFTESGGEYLFLARAVHPAAGMMAGWVSLLAGFTGAMAFAATTFESYLQEVLGATDSPVAPGFIAISLVLVAAIVHSLGLRRGTAIQNGIVFGKLVLIGLFLATAYCTVLQWQGGRPVPDAAAAVDSPSLSSWQFAIVFANALTWISLSYSGFNAAVYMTDEIDRPEINVPRAMVLGTVMVTLLYLLLNAVFVFAPPAGQIAGQVNVATIAAGSVGDHLILLGYTWGDRIEMVVRIAILAGLATSVLAQMQTGPRVYAKMASDGMLPGWLFRPSVLQGTSRQMLPSIWVQTALAILVIWVSSLREQLDYLGFTLSICAALCGSLVFMFRNHSEYPVRVWGYPIVPLIYVGGTLVIAALTAVRVPTQAAVGLATLGIGILAYFCSRILWGSRASGDRGN